MSADNWAACPRCKEPGKFREDFDIGVNLDGRFYVSYAGRCKKCGLIHTFKHEESVSLVGGGPK